jgi:hypothetical protein
MATRVYVMQLQFSKKCFLDNPWVGIVALGLGLYPILVLNLIIQYWF